MTDEKQKNREKGILFPALTVALLIGGSLVYGIWHDVVKIPQERISAYEEMKKSGVHLQLGSPKFDYARQRIKLEKEEQLLKEEIERLQNASLRISRNSHSRSGHYVRPHMRDGHHVRGHYRSGSEVGGNTYRSNQARIRIAQDILSEIQKMLVTMRKGKFPDAGDSYKLRRSLFSSLDWPQDF